MTIIEILNYLNKSIKTGFADTVSALKKHTYKVSFPQVQRIEGKVKVDFPQVQNVNVKFPDTQKITGSVKTDVEKHFISLINKVNETKSLIKDKGISVNNFPEIPKEIKISNFPKEKEISLATLENRLDSLNESIKKLPTKFPDFPKIPEVKFPAQKEIIFPKSFNVDNLEGLKSDDPEAYVPVRLTDGKEFYKAIEEFYQSVTSSVTFTDSRGRKQGALVDDDRHVQVDVLTMPDINIPDPDYSDLATKAIQTDGSQVTKIKEITPIDALNNNASLTISNADTTVTATTVLTKTINEIDYQKTISYNVNGDVISVSSWSEV